LEGHLSSALCHTGNISYRLGAGMEQAKIREKIKGDKLASESFDRMAQHLELNEVNIERHLVTFGESLEMDGKKETFNGNSKANEMLTRDYRKPFVVPAISIS
jgi:hypothetical protein